MHAFNEPNLLLIFAFIPALKTTTMDTHKQWGRFITLHQPKVKAVALLRPVDHIGMCGFAFRPISLPFSPLFLERLRFSERQLPILVGIGLRVALEDFLKIRVAL